MESGLPDPTRVGRVTPDTTPKMNSVLTPSEFTELENVLKEVILQPAINTTCLALLVLKRNISYLLGTESP